MNELPKHLGGHCGVTHTDEGALKWAIENLKAKSMIDVGCGLGGMVQLANSMGMGAIGVDGDFTLDRKGVPCIIHDYTLGVCDVPEDLSFDLAWSVEFLEHVERQYMPNYMDTFQKAHYVICTHATPGMPGVHHVNCQDDSYWITTFSHYDFNYLPEMTEKMRQASTMNIDRPQKKQFVRNTGKVFENKNWK